MVVVGFFSSGRWTVLDPSRLHPNFSSPHLSLGEHTLLVFLLFLTSLLADTRRASKSQLWLRRAGDRRGLKQGTGDSSGAGIVWRRRRKGKAPVDGWTDGRSGPSLRWTDAQPRWRDGRHLRVKLFPPCCESHLLAANCRMDSTPTLDLILCQWIPDPDPDAWRGKAQHWRPAAHQIFVSHHF